MRLLALGLLALLAAAPAQSQDAPADAQERIEPDPNATFVVRGMPGEAVRVTTYANRPPQRGRLARRYIGLRANRAPRAQMRVVPLRPVAPLIHSPSGTFVRRGTSYFPVVPAR